MQSASVMDKKKKLRIRRQDVLLLNETDLESILAGRGKYETSEDTCFCPVTPHSQTGCCPATTGTACTCSKKLC